ncbi:hypothetical protein FLX56_08065 [Synechococcus moorigangaii CMS01]|nr:hypothetical protein [Synechococcus moorigangaii CMS01]
MIPIVVAALSLQVSSECARVSPGAACVEAIIHAWNSGDAVAAGHMAGDYLLSTVESEGQLAPEGAGLAFIAAIGAEMERNSDAAYWFWVARQHEDVCGPLPDELRRVVDEQHYRIGSRRRGDRRVLASAFYEAGQQPCGGSLAPMPDIAAPAATAATASAPALIVFGDGSSQRAGLPPATNLPRNAPVQIIYEYPQGVTLSEPGLDEINRFSRFRAAVRGTIVVLNPCTPVYGVRTRRPVELCRADQPASGGD